MPLQPDDLIFVAGHRGLVGAAILRRLKMEGCTKLLTRRTSELDLRDQAAVNTFGSSTRDVEISFLDSPS